MVAVAKTISMVAVAIISIAVVAVAIIIAVSATVSEVSVAVAHTTSVVAACKAVAHASAIAVSPAIITAMIPTAAAVHPPAVSATIDGPEMGVTEVEIVAIGVAGVDAEVPIACIPVEWTIEIACCHIGVVLPVEQYVAKVQVALCPVCTIKVIVCVHTHQVVEVNLIGCLILLLGEV